MKATFFARSGVPVYEGQVVAENARDNDMTVNPTTAKKLIFGRKMLIRLSISADGSRFHSCQNDTKLRVNTILDTWPPS